MTAQGSAADDWVSGTVASARDAIRIVRSGRVVAIRDAAPATTLLDWLRLVERSTGTKEGCAEGDCGACTVALGRATENGVEYQPACSCITLLGQADGCEVVTVEDLGDASALHPVQAEMVARHGSQCGFCTPGIVMSLFCLHHEARERPAARDDVLDALAGNLCRCTGYRPIIEAGLAACAAPPVDGFSAAARERAAQLAALDEGGLFISRGGAWLAAPRSEDELATLYAAHPDATLVAGATDVGLWITKSLAELPRIILLNRVAGLDAWAEGAEDITLGATLSHARAMPLLAKLDPDLGALMRRFGSRQIRALGTVGGNLANGSPIGDLAPAFIALGATLHLRRADERRALPLERFFLDYRKQDRQPGEFVTSVTVRRPGPRDAVRVHKISKRRDEDISTVMGAFRFTLADGAIEAASIAFGGMAAIPKRASALEVALRGLALDDERGAMRAADALEEDFKPLTDQRASADYRMSAAKDLLRRSLLEIAAGTTSATRLADHRPEGARHAA